ncbi:hypothetical protein AUR67_00475 [Pseudoalteromonas sp. XI10]|uniref:hypothetical protein n=1 Tax=Pseudoalteromonas sp. XI10 TaxID=1766621 RepID=UPI0007339F77|nr:hypothetical protein [Pseudoalteromonas sp. XI10]KTG21987.1 hypothetical protein AUR67_00475 [Pseudoalteromonas sp. XI10]
MTTIFIIAIAAAAFLLILSTVFTMKNRYFDKQVRNLSEQYARLSIDFKNETNPTRAFELHAKAEKIKTDLELMIGKTTTMRRYDFELADIDLSSKEPEPELSLGELMRQIEEKNGSRVIYAKFNQDKKDS